MLRVAYGGTVPEGEICGSRSELREVAQALRIGTATLICSMEGSAHPYNSLLEKIVVQEAPGETPRVSVVDSSSKLEIRGDAVGLAILADNIEDLALHGNQGAHWHVEHIPEEPYVAADSYPVTISLVL
jgi:hypothetical protein